MVCEKRIRRAGARAAVIAIVFAVFAFRAPEWARGIDLEFVVYGQTSPPPSPPTTAAATGSEALYSNTTGNENTAIGQTTLYDNISGGLKTWTLPVGTTSATTRSNFVIRSHGPGFLRRVWA
jgi:hypothetical protein